MNSRERVFAAVRHQQPDRTPVDYWVRPDVTERLMAYVGVDSQEALYRRLGIDLRQVGIGQHCPAFDARANGVLGGHSAYSGGRFVFRDDGAFEDAWGIFRRQGQDGLYDEWVSGPFVDSTDLDAYPWPEPTIYEAPGAIARRTAPWREAYAVLGALDLPFKIAWHMRGMENFLCDMLVDPPFARDLLQRAARYEREKGLRLIAGGVDILGIYGDIAMQDRMLVSPRAWRALEKPILADLITAFRRAKSDLLMFYHSDGDISEVLPDLIEIGFDIVNPIQPECMDPAAVKRRYGDRMTLHGTISIQRTLPKGTVADVRAEVRRRIETCGRGGGLILCPANLVQNDTPLENIVALYDAAQ